MRFGISPWIQADHTWWVVRMPCVGHEHDQTIVDWYHEQFGYVDKGVDRVNMHQDFWFDHEHEAIAFWLTWGAS